MPFGCGQFQYVNTSFNKQDPPSIIRYALNEIDQYLEYLFLATQIPSVSYGIVYEDEIIYYKSFGQTNLNETNSKPTPDSIYRIGSISKVFTILMSYALRDEGTISFDDAIYKYNNKFSINNPWGITNEEQLGHTLTIKQLASQISGLPREAPCTYEVNTTDCIEITTDEIFDRLSKLSLIHATDVQASYSNLAYAILGNVLSQYVGDKSYQDSIHKLVIDPLNMTHTGLYLTSSQQPFASVGYGPQYRDEGYVDIGWVAPAGQLFSSINDLATLMKQYFASYPSRFQTSIPNRNKNDFLLSPQTYREMLRPVYINPDEKTGFGSPWEMQMLSAHYLRGKGGNINGFSSDIQMIPEMKLGVIALSNFELDESMFTLGTLEILIPAFKSWINSMQSDYKIDYGTANITKFVGEYYENDIPIFDIFIDPNTNNLMFTSSLSGIYGVLTWMGSNVNNGNSMIYNDLTNDQQSCWITTLSSYSGSTLQFIANSDGTIDGLMLPDNDWGETFNRKDSSSNKYDGRVKYEKWNKQKQHKLKTKLTSKSK